MAASPKKVRDVIDNAIKASAEIKEGNYVTVKVEKDGLFGKPYISLTGRSTSEAMREKIEAIATSNASGIDVKNQLRVSTTS